MPETAYRIIFNGLLADSEQHSDQVQARFSQLFKLSPEKTAQLFARSGATTLRSNLDWASAQRYLEKLRAIGVAASIDPARQPEQQSTSEPLALLDIPAQQSSTRHDSWTLEPKTSAQALPLQFVFTGNGGEYFRIWIVNLFLSIVTLGIYSAWAKVRKKRYFYGNTTLDGSSFEYHGDPVKILLGRIIASVFLALYIGADYFSMTASLVMFILLLVLMPWIIVKSLRFNARYSSYRNLHFHFTGELTESIKVFLLLPILGMLTLGLMMPYAIYRQQAFIVGNHGYAASFFDFSARPADYYKLFFMLAGGLFLAGVAGAALAGAGLPLLFFPLLILAYLLLFAGYAVGMNNLRFNHSWLDSHHFQASWTLSGYSWLFVSNSLAIVLTLGLFIPWAQVRTARYKADHLNVMASGSLDDFISTQQQQQQINPIGEGIGDLFDIDIGF